jgi:thiamine biosynthesis lipoprotein
MLVSRLRFEVWGMTGTLATEHEHQRAFAEERLGHWIDEMDRACNRFRDDSELTGLNGHRGESVAVGPTLELALAAALEASEATGGLCDPTVLPALIALGYDADYRELVSRDDVALAEPVPAVGPDAIDLDRDRHRVTLAPACRLDLGASAKALTADLVADDIAPTGGVVVEIGGDVAVRGRGPQGLWAIAVSDALVVDERTPRVAIADGGLATSSIAQRTWRAGGRVVNHVVDPRTGRCADGPYATASVSASSCLRANAFATAALLWGEDAGYHLAQAGCAARLVRRDGVVEYVGGWPRDEVRA